MSSNYVDSTGLEIRNVSSILTWALSPVSCGLCHLAKPNYNTKNEGQLHFGFTHGTRAGHPEEWEKS
jgi:hypothetical protein